MADIQPKFLHVWDVEVVKEYDETVDKIIDGQPAKVTQKVKKPVVTKMGLKQPTRRELRQAELFYGKEYNRFIKDGFLQRSILVNQHLDLTNGVLSEKERKQIATLAARHAELESDLVRSVNEPEAAREKIKIELAGVRAEINNLNTANEAVFSQTAEVKAQSQLGQWFAFNLVYIQHGDKWQTYFEGDTFEKKEEFSWKLEESEDEFYLAAIQKLLTYVHFFNMGANRPEQFRLIDDELKKEMEARQKAKDAAKAAPAPAAPVEADSGQTGDPASTVTVAASV